MFKSNIHYKTRQSPLKIQNIGGWHNTVWQFIPEVWLDYGLGPRHIQAIFSGLYIGREYLVYDFSLAYNYFL